MRPVSTGLPFVFLLGSFSCCCLSGFSQKPNDKEKNSSETSPVEYSRDTVMQRLDNAHLILNRINTSMDGEFDTRQIEEQLPAIISILQIIDNSLSLVNAIPEFKHLQLFGVMLDAIGQRLAASRSSLFKYNNELMDINAKLIALQQDSGIHHLLHDSLYLEIYLQELQELRQKWQKAKQTTQGNLTRIKAVQLRISKQYFRTVDLQSQIAYTNRQLGEQLFRNEYGYLWEKPRHGKTDYETRDMAIKSLQSQMPLVSYYVKRNRNDYIYLLVLGAAFFWWLRRAAANASLIADPAPGDTSPSDVQPFLYALIAILNIHPLFELHGSTFPINQLPLLAVLGMLFHRKWSHRHYIMWMIISILYVLFLATRTVLLQLDARISLLLLNIIAITLGFYSIKQITGNFPFNRLLQVASWVYLTLNVLAMPANILGRLSLARIFSNSAIFGVVQAFGLCAFIACIRESLLLQSAATRNGHSGGNHGNLFQRLADHSIRGLRLYAAVIWLLTLAINLNIYDFLEKEGQEILNHSFHIGSVSFQLGNLLLFLLILYISNVLQKYIGLIYGASDNRSLPESGKLGSRLAMLRLLVVVGGFLLAIGATGVPLDKLTIVLGALGVGIGLGLQNVVNAFVSGIILIFERPFQIGDFIELNNKKGIVRDIGMRSSKIVTEEGTEIIIPNSDLLSGQVINWTVRTRRVRIEIPLTIEAGHNFQEIEYAVQEVLAHQPGLSEDTPPRVLINTATEKTTSFTILAWVSNIGHIQTIKSEIINLLYQQFKEKGLRVV